MFAMVDNIKVDYSCAMHLKGSVEITTVVVLLSNRNVSPSWTCVSLTRFTTSSEWKLFRFDKIEVNDFAVLMFDVTF